MSDGAAREQVDGLPRPLEPPASPNGSSASKAAAPARRAHAAVGDGDDGSVEPDGGVDDFRALPLAAADTSSYLNESRNGPLPVMVLPDARWEGLPPGAEPASPPATLASLAPESVADSAHLAADHAVLAWPALFGVDRGAVDAPARRRPSLVDVGVGSDGSATVDGGSGASEAGSAQAGAGASRTAAPEAAPSRQSEQRQPRGGPARGTSGVSSAAAARATSLKGARRLLASSHLSGGLVAAPSEVRRAAPLLR